MEIGREIYRRARLPLTEPVHGGAVGLAVGLYGGDVIVESNRAQVEAVPARVNGEQKIVIHPRLSPRRLNFAVARAIARIETGREDASLAGYLVAPTEAFGRRLAHVGVELPELAQPFAITETCAALRVVEVGARDGVVVTPERVYRPGRLLSWADDATVRSIARGTPRSVRKVRASDEPGRVALFSVAC
jgi:hypothetical protein